MGNPDDARTQEFVDRYYWTNGKCCAGCDWWRYHSSGAGECLKSAPMSGDQRLDLLGISRSSLHIGAGHPMTLNSHVCGDFRDDFDWYSLPVAYLARVGAPIEALRARSKAPDATGARAEMEGE